VKVRCVLADHEFYATDVIAALLARSLKYVIPVPADDRIKRFQQGVEEVTVKRGHTLYGPSKHGVTNDPTVTRLVALPPDDSYDDVQVFATNLDVDDEIGLDRRRTKRQIERYNCRSGIENAYKKIKEFGAWTTKMDVGVRLFHFAWAVILYALWLLVDFLMKLSLDLEYEVGPRLKAGRFRDLFGRRFRELI
jgi:IS4 transposase